MINKLSYTNTTLEYIFTLCKQSPHILGNSDYKQKANNTKIKLNDTVEVNAYANTLDSDNHEIVMFSGILNMMEAFAYALAEFKHDEDLFKLHDSFHVIIDELQSNSYTFSYKSLNKIMTDLGYTELSVMIEDEAKSFFTGLTLTVIAHEMGHIALSHTVRSDGSYETSRNDERMADLFAQSVITTTPFGGYLVLSGLFMPIMLAWLDRGSSDDNPATTHPHSKERVMNALNSHEQYLAELGITKDNIVDFLPS